MAYRRYIKTTEDGRVLSDITSNSKLSEEDGWIEIPKTTYNQHHLLGLGLDRIRYDEGAGLSEKTRMRLSVGKRTFPADGETICAIGVRDMPDPNTEVRVVIDIAGGQEVHFVSQSEDLALTSTKVGQYTIRVEDPYFYAPIDFDKSAIVVQTYEPEEEET